MGLFDNLYGGGQQYGDLVGDPARQEAKRRALLAISAQLMQAGGPSRLPVSTGQAIGGALQAGQGASDEAYQSAIQAAVMRHRMQPQPQEQPKPMAVGGRLIDPMTGRVIYEPPAEQKPAAPPQTREINRGDKVVTEEWNGTGWKEVGAAPRWQPQQPQTQEPPKSRNINRDGKTVVQDWNPATRTWVDTASSPQWQPSDTKKSDADKNATWRTYQAARSGLVSALNETPTGKLVGWSPSFTADQQVADGAVAAMAPVLKQVFRSAGEGTFTDKDQEMLIAMIPTRSDKADSRRRKLENIDNIIKAKLGISDDGTSLDALLDKYAPK